MQLFIVTDHKAKKVWAFTSHDAALMFWRGMRERTAKTYKVGDLSLHGVMLDAMADVESRLTKDESTS